MNKILWSLVTAMMTVILGMFAWHENRMQENADMLTKAVIELQTRAELMSGHITEAPITKLPIR